MLWSFQTVKCFLIITACFWYQFLSFVRNWYVCIMPNCRCFLIITACFWDPFLFLVQSIFHFFAHFSLQGTSRCLHDQINTRSWKWKCCSQVSRIYKYDTAEEIPLESCPPCITLLCRGDRKPGWHHWEVHQISSNRKI